MVKHIGIGAGWPLNRSAQRTILDLQRSSGFWDCDEPKPSPSASNGNKICKPGYHNIDALFIAIRTLPWNADRHDEVQGACAKFLHAVTTFGGLGSTPGKGLNDEEMVLREFTDTHELAAPVYAVAICQQAFPQLVKTLRPWRFSGDKAPFI